LASIGPITSATLREFGLPAHVEAEEYTIAGLTRAIVADQEQFSRR
jgi:uroporphyrinogen-III synthase